MGYAIAPDRLEDAEVLALLQLHLDEMHSWSPACKVHALPAERLRARDVAFFTARLGGTLAAVGALKELSPDRGELKSMRAAPAFRGKGAGEAILLHLLAEARGRGYRWVGLETGRPEPFRPAMRLYAKHGFAECPAFGDYVADEFSLCMEKWL
ncbi:GNAT family N-acetyltransferase [Pelagerythrobacter marinus]|uniref:GNAT family N-acetyltransferase n=1 Tax=Pelagerythrobacter marinus TaxID=538382 RepID=UPI002036E8F0|nr:GNAT family N-acetyltransferase [Pelagerythrobacter marinus]USA39553.1 GNAT family N-acetyltransferase [Pelagerythrobacter marinus]WPZ06274.1 GNAT family N-acetyltransferase [Pelagerythrobacter marinus]